MSEQVGTVTWINGPVIRARGSRNVSMLELVEVGDEHLVGEVIGLQGDVMTAQVYEETSGMRPGARARRAPAARRPMRDKPDRK